MKRLILAVIFAVGSSVTELAQASNLLDEIWTERATDAEFAAAVSNPPDTEVRDDYGVTPLHIASGSGTVSETANSLQGGAVVNARNGYGDTGSSTDPIDTAR